MAGGIYRITENESPYKGNAIGNVTFSVGAEATNVITVAAQLKGQDLLDLAVRGYVYWYLSSDASGDVLASAASGGVTNGTDGIVKTSVTGISGFAVSESDGDIDFAITDSTARTVYLNVVLPNGLIVTSGAITFT